MRRDSFSGSFLDAAYDLHLQLYPPPTLVWWHQNRDRDCHLEMATDWRAASGRTGGGSMGGVERTSRWARSARPKGGAAHGCGGGEGRGRQALGRHGRGARPGPQGLYAMGEGARTRFLRQAAAFVFQSYNLVPYLTVEENATLPIALARGKVDRGRLRDLLGRFGLADRAKAPAGGLSGGEQQRAALVRALLSRPAVLFADEPTGALDTRNTALVLGVLREMADAGTTVVMVTHDVDAAATADRVAFVRDGLVTRVAGHCTPEQVLAGTREGAIGRG